MQETGSGGLWLIGLIVAAMGLYPVLAALNIIPTLDSDFHAPRWLVGVIASCFLWLGLALSLEGPTNAAQPNSMLRCVLQGIQSFFLYAGLGCFVGGMFIFLHWVLFVDATPMHGSISIWGVGFSVPAPLSTIIGKLFLGFALLVVYLLIGAGVWHAIKKRRNKNSAKPKPE